MWQKANQNRLRLGQFKPQRVGDTFEEVWTNGNAFEEHKRRQEELILKRKEIEEEKKSVENMRPDTVLQNGSVASTSFQYYYERCEIIKSKNNALKKMEAV